MTKDKDTGEILSLDNKWNVKAKLPALMKVLLFIAGGLTGGTGVYVSNEQSRDFVSRPEFIQLSRKLDTHIDNSDGTAKDLASTTRELTREVNTLTQQLSILNIKLETVAANSGRK